jgi:hypothetical protein
MHFETILKPYKEGGTKDRPVERTMGTMLDYFLNKKQYPLEIVGGAVFLVFNYLNSGGEFEGDGSYGSRGRELVTSIRMKCDDLLQQKLEAESYKVFLELYAEELKACLTPISFKQKLINWWHGRAIFK